MAEYSLLLALVAILCIATLTLLALRTSDAFDKANDGFNKGTPTGTDGGGGGGTGGNEGGLETPTTSPDCLLPSPPPAADCPTSTTAP
jgi:Flp pilus assembly pilin Flp